MGVHANNRDARLSRIYCDGVTAQKTGGVATDQPWPTGTHEVVNPATGTMLVGTNGTNAFGYNSAIGDLFPKGVGAYTFNACVTNTTLNSFSLSLVGLDKIPAGLRWITLQLGTEFLRLPWKTNKYEFSNATAFNDYVVSEVGNTIPFGLWADSEAAQAWDVGFYDAQDGLADLSCCGYPMAGLPPPEILNSPRY